MQADVVQLKLKEKEKTRNNNLFQFKNASGSLLYFFRKALEFLRARQRMLPLLICGVKVGR